MTAKDVKEITYMPLVTFFSILEQSVKNRKGVATTPLERRWLSIYISFTMVNLYREWMCFIVQYALMSHPFSMWDKVNSNLGDKKKKEVCLWIPRA